MILGCEAVAILAPYAEGITEASLQRIEATEPDTSFLDTTKPTIAAKLSEMKEAVKNWLPDFVRILHGQAGGLQLQRDRQLFVGIELAQLSMLVVNGDCL